ncbi:LysE family translocator [Henriciella sp.]|uniref:LysE family translocator n=1 Tax=Henriciella sp. TaxID=1968823 RepID=UPI002605C181|nr:LysE family translocator [Henriciella sp.]
MTIEHLLAFAAFAFVSSVTPGPNTLMLMASGTNYGVSRTVPHALGVSIGFVIMVVLVGLGLVRVFEMFPASYDVLKTVSVLYLVYLAWKIASAPPPAGDAKEGEASGGRPLTFLQAALFQWVNPKGWTMALTAVTAYTLPGAPIYSLLIIALLFGLINFPSVSSWAVMGRQLRRALEHPARLRTFNIIAALLLLGSLWPILTAGGLDMA